MSKERKFVITIDDNEKEDVHELLIKFMIDLNLSSMIDGYEVKDFNLIQEELINHVTDNKSDDYRAGVKHVVDRI